MRWQATIVLVLASGLAACGGPTEPRRLTGDFTLRAIYTSVPPYGAVPVPAAVSASLSGDTIRYVGGSFTLRADGTWRERLDQELVFAGAAAVPRSLESSGRYRATLDAQHRILLDLHPEGGPVVAVIALGPAVLAGDTLYQTFGIFVR